MSFWQIYLQSLVKIRFGTVHIWKLGKIAVYANHIWICIYNTNGQTFTLTKIFNKIGLKPYRYLIKLTFFAKYKKIWVLWSLITNYYYHTYSIHSLVKIPSGWTKILYYFQFLFIFSWKTYDFIEFFFLDECQTLFFNLRIFLLI